MIPILLAMAGAGAGQAKGHNTKSTLEGAGLGALLGVGGAVGGAAGAGGEAGADAGATADATAVGASAGSSALDSTALAGADLSGFGGTAGGSALDLGSLTATNPAFIGATTDAGDAAMLGGGASQGIGAADMGAMAGGVNPTAPGLMGTMGSMPSSFAATPFTPSASATPSMMQSIMSNPTISKGAGKLNDMGWSTAMQQMLTPQYRTTTPGQPIMAPPPAPVQGQSMQMPNYAQQMQMLGLQ
jgi:hypothetical protein